MVTPGLVLSDAGAHVDLDRLRRQRRDRVFAEMAVRSLDAVILGRESNARYATGVQRLPLLGSRPFAPSAVLIGPTREAHLLSGWDYTVPPGTSAERCFGTHWDPELFVPALQAIDGLGAARRVGVDFVSPAWRDRLAQVCPHAELVDATPALRTLRMIKTDDEIACVRAAVAASESALAAGLRVLRPGRTERETLGPFARRLGELGLTVPAFEGTCSVMDSDSVSSFRRSASTRALEHGDRVALSGGVLFAGYEGAVGRTATARAAARPPSSGSEPAEPWQDLWSCLAPVLRPGVSGDTLRRAYTSSGAPRPPFPVVLSVGLGVEAPIAGSGIDELDAHWTLADGMVLQVQGLVAGPRGPYFALETVLITDHGYELLTTLAHTTTW